MWTDLLQDLPDFLVEADWDSVQRSVQTPPAQPLAMSGILGDRNTLRNVQRFYWRKSVPLNSEDDEKTTKKKIRFIALLAPSPCFVLYNNTAISLQIWTSCSSFKMHNFTHIWQKSLPQIRCFLCPGTEIACPERQKGNRKEGRESRNRCKKPPKKQKHKVWQMIKVRWIQTVMTAK